MFGFIVFVWACTWIFEVNVSDNQICEPGWEDIQAAICELNLLFFVFCIWCIDAGTYDFFIFLTLASVISLATVIATFLFQPPVPPSPPILTLSLLDMTLVFFLLWVWPLLFFFLQFSLFLLSFVSHIQTPKPIFFSFSSCFFSHPNTKTQLNWIETDCSQVGLVFLPYRLVSLVNAKYGKTNMLDSMQKLPSTPIANRLHPLMFEL